MATTKVAVPKRIGGVKIPKPLRRDLKKLSGSKSGRVRIADALIAAGAALAVVEARAAATDRGAKASLKPKAKSKARARPLVKGAKPALKLKLARPKPLLQPLPTSNP